jgi:hypothetical protein
MFETLILKIPDRQLNNSVKSFVSRLLRIQIILKRIDIFAELISA